MSLRSPPSKPTYFHTFPRVNAVLAFLLEARDRLEEQVRIPLQLPAAEVFVEKVLIGNLLLQTAPIKDSPSRQAVHHALGFAFRLRDELPLIFESLGPTFPERAVLIGLLLHGDTVAAREDGRKRAQPIALWLGE